MNIPPNLLPSELLLAAHIGWLLILLQALRRAPWSRLRSSDKQHVFLGAVVAFLLLWHLDVGVTPGLGFHFLGVTVFTLMFGWSLAVLGVSLAFLGALIYGGGALETLSINALLFGVLPVSVSFGIYQLVHRHLPHHLFIYIFLCGFFGSILAAASAVMTVVVILTAANIYPFNRIAEEYLPFLPLYLLPEGLLNGMLTTIFVGLRPQWLCTFDDESYLKR